MEGAKGVNSSECGEPPLKKRKGGHPLSSSLTSGREVGDSAETSEEKFPTTIEELRVLISRSVDERLAAKMNGDSASLCDRLQGDFVRVPSDMRQRLLTVEGSNLCNECYLPPAAHPHLAPGFNADERAKLTRISSIPSTVEGLEELIKAFPQLDRPRSAAETIKNGDFVFDYQDPREPCEHNLLNELKAPALPRTMSLLSDIYARVRGGHNVWRTKPVVGVAASPGSGKTRFLVELCNKLSTEGVGGVKVQPIAITFTNETELLDQERTMKVDALRVGLISIAARLIHAHYNIQKDWDSFYPQLIRSHSPLHLFKNTLELLTRNGQHIVVAIDELVKFTDFHKQDAADFLTTLSERTSKFDRVFVVVSSVLAMPFEQTKRKSARKIEMVTLPRLPIPPEFKQYGNEILHYAKWCGGHPRTLEALFALADVGRIKKGCGPFVVLQLLRRAGNLPAPQVNLLPEEFIKLILGGEPVQLGKKFLLQDVNKVVTIDYLMSNSFIEISAGLELLYPWMSPFLLYQWLEAGNLKNCYTPTGSHLEKFLALNPTASGLEFEICHAHFEHLRCFLLGNGSYPLYQFYGFLAKGNRMFMRGELPKLPMLASPKFPFKLALLEISTSADEDPEILDEGESKSLVDAVFDHGDRDSMRVFQSRKTNHLGIDLIVTDCSKFVRVIQCKFSRCDTGKPAVVSITTVWTDRNKAVREYESKRGPGSWKKDNCIFIYIADRPLKQTNRKERPPPAPVEGSSSSSLEMSDSEEDDSGAESDCEYDTDAEDGDWEYAPKRKSAAERYRDTFIRSIPEDTLVLTRAYLKRLYGPAVYSLIQHFPQDEGEGESQAAAQPAEQPQVNGSVKRSREDESDASGAGESGNMGPGPAPKQQALDASTGREQ